MNVKELKAIIKDPSKDAKQKESDVFSYLVFGKRTFIKGKKSFIPEKITKEEHIKFLQLEEVSQLLRTHYPNTLLNTLPDFFEGAFGKGVIVWKKEKRD